MFINILLAIAFLISAYLFWKRISFKIPELILIPDKHISELLEENTAKLQRFFLHLFHFRSFYRERHYHARARYFFGRLLYRIHSFLLWLDNKIVDRIKYIHEEPEKNTAEIPAQENRGRIDLSYLREDRENMPAASVVAQAVSVMAPRGTPQSEMQSTQEIKRKRVRPVVGVSSPRASRTRKTASSEGPLAENKELP